MPKRRHAAIYTMLLLLISCYLFLHFAVLSGMSLSVAEARENKAAYIRSGHRALFLVAKVPSQNVYVGQEAIYIVKLFRICRIDDLSLILPDVARISFVSLGEPACYQENVAGETYEVLEVRYSFVPHKAGILRLPPAIAFMKIFGSPEKNEREKADGSYCPPFFVPMGGRYLSISSNSVELTVLPLPEDNIPQNFTGLVGRYEMVAQITPPIVVVGKPSTLTVRIQGEGEIDRLPTLKLPDLGLLRVYKEKPDTVLDRTPEGTRGAKIMRWALVADRPGVFRIPPFSISYFNTNTKKYTILNSSPLCLKVVSSSSQISPVSGSGKSDDSKREEVAKDSARDICPLHESTKLMREGDFIPDLSVSLLWIVVPALISLGSYGGAIFRKQLGDPDSRYYRKKAKKIFVKKLKAGSVSYTEVLIAFRDYLNRRFALSLGNVTVEDCERILRSRNLDDKFVCKLKNLMGVVEEKIFTGHGDQDCQIVGELLKLIEDMEKELE